VENFVYTVVYPDGKSEVVLKVTKYDFNWQLTYELKKPLFLPRGSRLECVARSTIRQRISSIRILRRR